MYFAFLTGAELLVVVMAIIILFGATRLPQLGEALGKGIHNFRKAVSGQDDKDTPALKEGQSSTNKAAPNKESSNETKPTA